MKHIAKRVDDKIQVVSLDWPDQAADRVVKQLREQWPAVDWLAVEKFSPPVLTPV